LSLVGNLIVHVTNKKGKLEITAAGQKTMDNLVYFMKKNTALQHLDLTSCGLLRPQLEHIAGAVVKCGSLVGLHLCLNPGVDQDCIDFFQKRVKCMPLTEQRKVAPYKEHSQKLRPNDFVDQQVLSHCTSTKRNYETQLRLPDV
jgi:hypothetical protein